MKETSIRNKPGRFAVWCVLSLMLLTGVSALFAAFGVRPEEMGGTGTSSAYAVFLSILYMVDAVCLSLIGGIKNQAGFPAAHLAVSALILLVPQWWGAPFYGVTLHFGEELWLVRIFAAGTLVLSMAGFWIGKILHKKGWGAPIQPEPVEKIDVDAFLRELREEQEAIQKEEKK